MRGLCSVAGPALPPGYNSNAERHGCDQEHASHAHGETVWDSEDGEDSSPTPRLVCQHKPTKQLYQTIVHTVGYENSFPRSPSKVYSTLATTD